MKKILILVMFIASSVFVASYGNTAQASDYYLGVYEDGREAYLMEEEIEIFDIFSRNGTPEGKEFQCTVKAVNPSKSSDYEYMFYSVTCSQFLGMTKNDEKLYNRKTQYAYFESHPVEKNLADYIGKLYESKFGPGAW